MNINNRQQQNNNRRRGRNNNNRQQNNNRSGFDYQNQIDNRARGNAAQMLEKYKKLAQDAQFNGDRVNAEYHLQFADHYLRVLSPLLLFSSFLFPLPLSPSLPSFSPLTYSKKLRYTAVLHSAGRCSSTGRAIDL